MEYTHTHTQKPKKKKHKKKFENEFLWVIPEKRKQETQALKK